MTEGEKAIVEQLAAIRSDTAKMRIQLWNSGRVLVALTVVNIGILLAVAAIAFGWVEVAIKVKDAGF